MCEDARKEGAVLARLLAAGVTIIAAFASLSIAGATSTAGARYEPVLHPGEFTTVIDNRYFPLPVGRTWVYKGIKDGQTQVDTVRVLRRTKLVAEGIRATVVLDVATHHTRLLEKTFDWYAQDKLGNVWYLGEDTTAYGPGGRRDKSGSWEAGVEDAEPGLVMKTAPRILDTYRQEYLPGTAEDTAWTVGTTGSITVPFGPFRHVLTSLEATRVEPGLYDQKVYARGIGNIFERSVTGPRETALLVAMHD